LRILRIARPEDTHLPFDFLVGDARIVGHAALAGDAQLLEDLARAAEREAARAAERPGQVLDDPPVLPGFAGTVHGLVDLDHAALDLRHQALVLFLEASGHDDVRVPRRVVE